VPRAIGVLEPLVRIAFPLQPCLRDIWHDHVLFTGDEVTGIIDFGGIDIDTPAVDVARLLGSLVGSEPPGWETGIDAYSAIRPLSSDERRAVTALDKSGTVLAGCNWIRWIYVEKRRFQNRSQVVTRFTRLLERLRAV
jgi:Ser/Thr protein kinase RdoA (MazF antagonist)